MKYYISRLKYKLNKKLLIYTLVLLVSFFNVKNYSLMSSYRTEEIEKNPVLRTGDLIVVESGFINLAGVLSEDSILSINLFRAICFENPQTRKITFFDKDNILGVKEILLIPFPKLYITKSSALLFDS